MKLSTRSRYGSRMMLELARHYYDGPVQMGDIAKRQNISVKYLEQLIIPLKKANLIKSTRGPKGGHMLTKPPEKITMGDVVRILEGGIDLSDCVDHPETCERSDDCLTRDVWKEATDAVIEKLDAKTLSELIEKKT